MAADLLFCHLKVSVGRHVVENTSRECASWREAGIQLDKLDRTLSKVAARISHELELVLPGKKVRKQTGKEIQRLDRQSKAVDKFLKQLVFESNVGKMDIPPKKLRAAADLWVKSLNRNLHVSARMLLPGPPVVVGTPAVSGFKKSMTGFKGMWPRK